MVREQIEYPAGVCAALLIDAAGRIAVDVTDPTLGNTTITGFGCEADARTFLYIGDFDDCPDNTAYATAGLAGLRWS